MVFEFQLWYSQMQITAHWALVSSVKQVGVDTVRAPTFKASIGTKNQVAKDFTVL